MADHVLERFSRAEVLHQLPLGIRLAGVAMVGEPAAVLRSELPRLQLAQVGEDFSRATVKPAVLGLEHGDLVCGG